MPHAVLCNATSARIRCRCGGWCVLVGEAFVAARLFFHFFL